MGWHICFRATPGPDEVVQRRAKSQDVFGGGVADDATGKRCRAAHMGEHFAKGRLHLASQGDELR